MMKIHTTQDLNLSVIRENSTNNSTIPHEVRYNFLENKHRAEMSNGRNDVVSFKAKGGKPEAKDIKKIINMIKKVVGEMKQNASPEVKRGDKIYRSPLFNSLLRVVDYETVVQSTIAAVACVLRALTIVGMSNEENKGNNAYAAGHALASGLVGFITVFALTTPFKAGADHVFKNMYKDLKLSTLKRLHPNLDEKSIVNEAGERIPEKIKEVINGKEVERVLWKNKDGLDFSKEIKNCDMLPKFKQLAEVSVETFENILGVKNVDWAAQKGKSFNEVVTKDGKKLYDIIDFSNLGIKVSHFEQPVGKKPNLIQRMLGKEVKAEKIDGQILFKDLDKEYLADLIANADENSIWRNLEINSVFKDGKIQDFRSWVGKDGKQWKLDLDSIFVSSQLETFDQAPRITGRMRFDANEGIHKFRTYQRNGVDGGLGTEISDEMLKAEKESAGLLKSLTWIPDLVFRIPIAMTTVALIPWMLKNLFHIEKQKPASAKPVEQKVDVKNNAQVDLNKNTKVAFKGVAKLNDEPVAEQDTNENVSFKAGTPKKPGIFKRITEIIGEFMAKLYGKPLIESETMAKISAKLADVPGGLTQAMATFGALLTSGTYVARTLNNKDLDQDKRRTLAINQTLCFIVPTIAAYSVDKAINNKVKNAEYRFGNLQRGEAALAKARGNISKADEILAGLGDKVKGVRILASLAVFTIIYRYATPVLITPLANRLGDWYNAKLKASKEAENSKAAA